MWEDDLEQPDEESKTGDEDEDHPPPPEDEEVVLVEHVVGEKTENVLLVGISSNSTSLHCAGDLSGKKVAHRVGWACQLGKVRVPDEAIVALDIDTVAGIFFVEE